MRAVTRLTAVAGSFITTSAVAPGLPALRTTASSLRVSLISDGVMCVASTFTVTTSFVAPTTTTTTTTATSAMSATAMAAVGANIWHQRLGRPNERTMQATWNIAETNQVTSTRKVVFIEVPSAAISTATGAEGNITTTSSSMIISSPTLTAPRATSTS